MAEGNFNITKFALGDDEIDYSLYNKNHASGSAYYDLTILQTPVFEAHTQTNAGINYGLLPNTRTDLLYLPVMKTNELNLGAGVGNIASSNGVFYVLDRSGDTGTTSTTNIEENLKALSVDYMDGSTGTNFVLCEAGLDTGFGNIPLGTEANKASYLNTLIDDRAYLYLDNRFFISVKGSRQSTSHFRNNTTSTHNLDALFDMGDPPASTLTIGLDNYTSYLMQTVNNEIFYYSTNNTEQNYSVIGGPRSIAIALSLVPKVGLDAEYSLYGGTDNAGGANRKFIDTTVYLQGATTSAQVQIPVRIIRMA